MNYIKQLGKEYRNMKKENLINIIGIFTLAGLLLVSAAESREPQISMVSHQPQLAEEVLRFHVIANSDSEEDQDLKLKVKEAVLETVRPMLDDAQSAREAEMIIFNHMEEIEDVADEVIEKEGYTYSSKGVLGKTTFPVKQYGDMVFPAGEYEAFRILLGEAKGRNWWCVMFPTLCYVDETYDVITEENKEQFREILTEEEYNSLLSASGNSESQVFYKLKSVVWLNKVIDYFSK